MNRAASQPSLARRVRRVGAAQVALAKHRAPDGDQQARSEADPVRAQQEQLQRLQARLDAAVDGDLHQMPRVFLDEHVMHGRKNRRDGDARVLLVDPLRRPGAATAVAEVQPVRARVDAACRHHLDAVRRDVLERAVHLRVQVPPALDHRASPQS